MIFRVEKTESIYLSVEADDAKSALEKARRNEFSSIDRGPIVYGIPGNPATLQRIEAEPWPKLLLPMKLLAKEGDRGAGDIIARVIGPIGGDAFKDWYKKLFGKDCGCGNRQEALNRRWPL